MNIKYINISILICALLVVFYVNAEAQTIPGEVLDQDGEPMSAIRLRVVETEELTETTDTGQFQFQGSWETPYTFLIFRAGDRINIRAIPTEGEPLQLIVNEPMTENIVVTASPHSHHYAELHTPTSVMYGDDILLSQSHNLAQTLKNQPGVHASSYGSGAGRPVLRGLSGNRVSVLTNLMPSLDASATSPDHAISGESLRARQIEILRGPKTLRFGSNAIGGVINIVDDRIPHHNASDTLNGRLLSKAGTDGQPGILYGQLRGNTNGFHWYTDALSRRNSDLSVGETDIPLANSDGSGKSAITGLSFGHSPDTYIGVALERTDTEYGLPLLPGESETIRLDVQQNRLDVAAKYTPTDSIIDFIHLKFADNDYDHVELEGEDIGTRFSNQASQLRIEADHKNILGWHGKWGLQRDKRAFEAQGEEAFVPPSVIRNTGVYISEERDFTLLNIEFGLRADRQTVDSPALPDTLNYTAQSASVALHFSPLLEQRISLHYAHAQRPPGAEELLSNGPHLATQSWESGNRNLNKEYSNNIDLSIAGEAGQIAYSLNLFHNVFNDYIFERVTGDTRDFLTELQFTQADARFYGYEIRLSWAPENHSEWQWQFEFLTDDLFARFDNDDWLARMPPGKTQLSVSLSKTRWNIHSVLTHVREQNRVSGVETATPGYIDWTLDVVYTPAVGDDKLMIFASLNNILDSKQVNHTSFIKERSPLAGRTLSAGFRYEF